MEGAAGWAHASPPSSDKVLEREHGRYHEAVDGEAHDTYRCLLPRRALERAEGRGGPRGDRRDDSGRDGRRARGLGGKGGKGAGRGREGEGRHAHTNVINVSALTPSLLC